jgi:hypothetical protein
MADNLKSYKINTVLYLKVDVWKDIDNGNEGWEGCLSPSGDPFTVEHIFWWYQPQKHRNPMQANYKKNPMSIQGSIHS